MDTRAYLQSRIEAYQAEKERRRRTLEKAGYVFCLVAVTALWIAGWMIR